MIASVPVVIIPVTFDQPFNCKIVRHLNIGRCLKELNATALVEALESMQQDQNVLQNVHSFRESLLM